MEMERGKAKRKYAEIIFKPNKKSPSMKAEALLFFKENQILLRCRNDCFYELLSLLYQLKSA